MTGHEQLTRQFGIADDDRCSGQIAGGRCRRGPASTRPEHRASRVTCGAAVPSRSVRRRARRPASCGAGKPGAGALAWTGQEGAGGWACGALWAGAASGLERKRHRHARPASYTAPTCQHCSSPLRPVFPFDSRVPIRLRARRARRGRGSLPVSGAARLAGCHGGGGLPRHACAGLERRAVPVALPRVAAGVPVVVPGYRTRAGGAPRGQDGLASVRHFGDLVGSQSRPIVSWAPTTGRGGIACSRRMPHGSVRHRSVRSTGPFRLCPRLTGAGVARLARCAVGHAR